MGQGILNLIIIKYYISISNKTGDNANSIELVRRLEWVIVL